MRWESRKIIASCLIVIGLLCWGYRLIFLPKESFPNVIIMTFQGISKTETIDDPTHQYIPNIWNKLKPKGTLYTNLINRNCQFHMSSVQAINTGDIYEATWGIFNPTFFHYVKNKYRVSQNKLWMIGQWFNFSCSFDYRYLWKDKNAPCTFATLQPDENYKNKSLVKILSAPELEFNEKKIQGAETLVTKWPVWDSMSGIYHKILMRILREYHPKVIHFLLGGPEAAHYGNYARYVISIQDADRDIKEVWDFIQNDQYYKENTYLIITADHSRDVYYRHHYNSQDKPVWLYVFGPDIKSDIVIDRPVYHSDIFVTVAQILKLKTHPTEGKILFDCFEL